MPAEPLIPAYLCRRVTRETVDTFTVAELAELGRLSARRGDWPHVRALLAAGWQPDWLGDQYDPEPGAWRWRRPGKRPGRPGRLFPSTGQAYNALMREGES